MAFGNACSQQNYTLPQIQNLNYSALATFVSRAKPSEDCTCFVYASLCIGERETSSDWTLNVSGLYANVYRPSGVTQQSKLPVVVVSTIPVL